MTADTPNQQGRNIVLSGMMGSGKSTIGRIVAELLGQPSWAHHKLEERMAKEPGAVWEMYDGVVPALGAAGREEIAALRELLVADTGDDDAVVQRWDWRYYHTRIQREQHGIDNEEVAAHFPLEQVLDGMFALTGDVFGIDHEPLETEVWHEDVRSFVVSDRESGERIATVHMDLFPREGTYGHAAAFMTLLNAGAELRAADAEGETPMSLATARGDVELLKQLQTWVRAELERRRADGGGRDEL